jgi:hypothetical protein
MSTLHMIKTLALNEIRLRSRRLSTIFALFGIVALSWFMIVDPVTGKSMLVTNQSRVLYNSAALAIGSASLIAPFFALIGFYLVRGRMAEDVRSGVGGVIASTSVRNASFLFSRWLGGVVYLTMLIVGFASTILVLHLLRGQGPIEPLIYLKTYALVLLPMIFFAVSCATFFDSVVLLMGKAGDVLYFVAWVMQISLIGDMDKSTLGQLSSLVVFDFTGIATSVFSITSQFSSKAISIGASKFDPSLPVHTLVFYWPLKLVLFRCATAVLALLPLLPAIFLFHRFSPDKVKMSSVRKRRSPLEILNGWFRPLAKQVQPLFKLAAALPSTAGQILSEVALTLVNSPFSILALVFFTGAAALVGRSSLFGVLNFAIVFWGVLICDISTRDFQSGLEAISGAVKGGAGRRYWRQFSATFVLGLMFTGVVLLRWLVLEPGLALALVLGLLSLSAVATMLGRCSRAPRTFMVLFLFWIYVCTQASKIAIIDAVGFNGVANAESMLWQLKIGVFAFALGYVYNWYKAK